MTVLKRLNQFIERKVVTVRGKGGIVMRWLGEATAADFSNWRGQSALRAARFGKFGQAGRAGGTQEVSIAGVPAKQAILCQPVAWPESCASLQALVLR